jgi:hypothetical protein
MREDQRRYSPSTERNREPLFEVLQEVLRDVSRGTGPQTLLEIASGTGEHGAHLAPRFPDWLWQPSDQEPAALQSIAAWVRHMALPNLLHPMRLDVTERWPTAPVSAVLCVNMIHISPWACTEALIRGAAGCLSPGGVLITYGPYKVAGEHTAPSNLSFDGWLKAQDPRWGVRDRDAIAALADEAGLTHVRSIPMPANNQTLVFGRN